jgi:hypothetical protein
MRFDDMPPGQLVFVYLALLVIGMAGLILFLKRRDDASRTTREALMRESKKHETVLKALDEIDALINDKSLSAFALKTKAAPHIEALGAINRKHEYDALVLDVNAMIRERLYEIDNEQSRASSFGA